MGAILSSKVDSNGKVIFEVCIDYEEAIQLSGLLENVHLFSEDVNNIKTTMSQRGKNEATKYFLIPKQLRKDLRFSDEAFCQRIDTKTKVIFIYVIDKFKMG
ncbi:MAG: hypothetical protein KKD17_02785 [Nanoarchaeota archaeon]|nr:hypothetical protein [Nanoarchaeota archaeon]